MAKYPRVVKCGADLFEEVSSTVMKPLAYLIEGTMRERRDCRPKYAQSVKVPPRGKYWSNLWKAYSPKLGREITLYSDLEYYNYITVEANPVIQVYCEQPTYARIYEEGKELSSIIDMWVLFKDGNEEFWEVKYQQDLNVINERIMLQRQLAVQKEWCEINRYSYNIRCDQDIEADPVLIDSWGKILLAISHTRNMCLEHQMIKILKMTLCESTCLFKYVVSSRDCDEFFAALSHLLSLDLVRLADPSRPLSMDAQILPSPQTLQFDKDER